MSFPLRKAVVPGGGQVMLDPKWRTFRFVNDSTQLVSVSKILGKYFPFDDKTVSETVAMKSGSTVEAVKAEWRKSAVLGTNVHNAIEARLLGKEVPPFTEVHGGENLFVPAAIKGLEKLTESYDIIAQEAIIVSRKTNVAGVVDFVAKNKTTGKLMIGDWKTTASSLSSFRFGSFQTPAEGVLSHLPNSKGTRASLQVLMLGHMMKLEGYSAIYGPEVNEEMEYGIINIGKSEKGGDVSVSFDRVVPEDIVPPDMRCEVTFNDVIRSVLLTFQ